MEAGDEARAARVKWLAAAWNAAEAVNLPGAAANFGHALVGLASGMANQPSAAVGKADAVLRQVSAAVGKPPAAGADGKMTGADSFPTAAEAKMSGADGKLTGADAKFASADAFLSAVMAQMLPAGTQLAGADAWFGRNAGLRPGVNLRLLNAPGRRPALRRRAGSQRGEVRLVTSSPTEEEASATCGVRSAGTTLEFP